MKSNKRIVSLTLASAMILGSASSAFAAPRDLHSKSGETTHRFQEYARDTSLFREILSNGLEQYLVEGNEEKLYDAAAVNNAMAENPGKRFDEILEEIPEEEAPSEELEVVEVSAITQTIADGVETELTFLVNGEELTGAEFLEKYEGYTVEFKYNFTSDATEKAGTVTKSADFKYAVQVTDAEGNKLPETVVASDFVDVAVEDATEATKVNSVALYDGSDEEWTAATVAVGDTVVIKAAEWENIFGETGDQEDDNSITEPTDFAVTSSDPTIAYYDGGIQVLNTGSVTFTVEFEGIEEALTLTVDVKAAQEVAGIEADETTAKVEAGVAATAVKFSLLDKDGEAYRKDVADTALFYTATLEGEEEGDTATGVAATAGAVELSANWEAGVYTVNVYNAADLTADDTVEYGSFTFEAVAVDVESIDFSLVFDDEEKTTLDLYTFVDTATADELDINVEGYVDGVQLGATTLGTALTGFSATSSDEDVAAAVLDTGVITVTLEDDATLAGDIVITLVKEEGDLVTEYAEITVEVVNTTPQVTELNFVEDVDAVAGEITTADLEADVDADSVEAADIVAALTAGKDDEEVEIFSAEMIDTASIKFIERVYDADAAEVTGKVMFTLKDIYGGESFIFDGVVTAE